MELTETIDLTPRSQRCSKLVTLKVKDGKLTISGMKPEVSHDEYLILRQKCDELIARYEMASGQVRTGGHWCL